MDKKATRDAYGEALVELGKKDPRIVVLDADLSGSTRTAKFAKEFPDRFFNMGIAEQNLMVAAAGFAITGFIPFASTFAIFATGRAWEPIRQSIAYSNINVKIVASHAGITVGEDGGSHQAVEDITLMRVIPNMHVFVPADATETRKVIEKVVEIEGPCYVRTGRSKVPIIFDDNYKFEPGKAHRVREGKDVSIIATGIEVYESLRAAELLKREGISASVVNMSSIKPIDKEIIVEEAESTGRIVTVEEHSIYGGLGSAVAEVLCQSLPAKLKIIGIKDEFGISGKAEELVKYFGLDSESIAREVKRFLNE